MKSARILMYDCKLPSRRTRERTLYSSRCKGKCKGKGKGKGKGKSKGKGKVKVKVMVKVKVKVEVKVKVRLCRILQSMQHTHRVTQKNGNF